MDEKPNKPKRKRNVLLRVLCGVGDFFLALDGIVSAIILIGFMLLTALGSCVATIP